MKIVLLGLMKRFMFLGSVFLILGSVVCMVWFILSLFVVDCVRMLMFIVGLLSEWVIVL